MKTPNFDEPLLDGEPTDESPDDFNDRYADEYEENYQATAYQS